MPSSFLHKAQRSFWLGWLLDNPLLMREIRRRMRGRLFSWSLILYVAALGGLTCLLMFIHYPFGAEHLSLREIIRKVGAIGSYVFTGMCVVEGAIAILIAPMLTAGLATAEKEKDTFDFLRVTTLHARTFVLGCLLTTASFLLLVFTCTLPVLGLTFIFGGVSMREILGYNITLFFAAMALCSWGVFNSTNYRRSRTVFGAVIGVVVLVYFSFRLLMNMFSRVGGAFFLTAGPLGVRWGVLAALALAVVFFAVAAARRLYEPNNRLFNYKQFLCFYLAALGLLAGYAGYMRGSPILSAAGSRSVDLYLGAYFILGWVLILTATAFFSVGRVERGDEVWRLRWRRPFFRRTPEQWFVYGFLLAVWLGPLVPIVRFWSGDPGAFFGRVARSLPLMLSAFMFAVVAARFASGFSAYRNRSMLGFVCIMIGAWGVIPMIGYLLSLPSALSGTSSAPSLLYLSAQFLMDFSPIPSLYGVWTGAPDANVVTPTCLILIQALAFFVPTRFRRFRSRFVVSYNLEPAPAAPPSDGQVSAGA